MRVVLDTNLVLSALLTPGVSRKLLLIALKSPFELFTSPVMLEEMRDVLGRLRFKSLLDNPLAVRLIDILDKRTKIVKPTVTVNVCRDTEDNKILEAAVAAKADIIISGDGDLLALNPFHGVEIIPPGKFLARLKA